MSHHSDLDDSIIDVGRPFVEKALSPFDTATFFGALRKLAAPGAPAPDQDLAEHEQKVVTGDEASPADAQAMYDQGQPDTAGHLEGEFAVPLDQVVTTMAQLVSHEMKLQLAYIYYAEMLRGLNRDLSEVFDEIAEQEIEDAKYLLRRISVLMPGGVEVPVAPSPVPLADPQQILEQMISGEQQAIVLLKALRSMMGENPMKFTVEEMLSEEQEHLDRLWQFMPIDVPEKQASQAKIAAAVAFLRRKVGAAAQPPVVPAPGAEPIEHYLLREQQLQLQQGQAETQDMAIRLQQTQDLAAQHQMAAEQANATAQQSAQQAEMATQQAAQLQQQVTASTELATSAQADAAAQADAKMRLSMRIQQIRQQLADIASQDPVAEEGLAAGVGQAGPGGPVTPQQQAEQQAAEQEAQQAEAMAQEQEQAAAVGGSKAKKEVQQAQKAQQNAQVQGQQAQQASQGV